MREVIQAGDGTWDGSLCGVPRGGSLEAAAVPRVGRSPLAQWEDGRRVRKTLVPPQGGIKTPYVPGINRCSCGVTPFAVPSLPPRTRSSSIAGADSPYSWGRPQRGSPSRPDGVAGAFGEGVVCRAGPNSAWSQKPLSCRDPAHVRCHSFAEAFVMQLPLFWKQEGKEALKFFLTWVGFVFMYIFSPCDG